MRRVLAALTATLFAGSLALRAADAPPPSAAAPTDQELQKAKQQAAFEQERLRRQFNAFQQSLLTLAQRYEKSGKAEEREKAVVLRQAIDLAGREGVDNQFNKLVATLTASGISLQDINAAIGQNQQLTKTLREMIAVLLTDNQTAKLKEEQRRLQDLLKQLEKIIREQKLERSKTESGRHDADQLAKGQARVTGDTKKFEKALDKDGKGGKDDKAEGKGEGKDGKPAGEGKDDTKDPKGDRKDAQGKPGDKDAKDSQGEGKPMGGEPKDGQGEGKPKGGDPKDGQGEGKPMGGEPKDGLPKDGQPKPNEGGPKDPAENKGRQDGKGEPKPGQGEGDAKGEPKDAQGEPKDGQKGQPQKGQSKGGQQGGQPPDGQPPSQQQQQQGEDDGPNRKQVQDAIENQQHAEKNLKKNDRKNASAEQDEAIKKLEEVRKEIERRLKQMREEELERLLANLEARCQRMLALQIEVYDGTKRVHGTIQANEGQKATRAEDLKAGELSAREGVIVTEANKALQLLEEDGTAVAVPQVLEAARDDMLKVQNRLYRTDVGPFTQTLEEEIIASLKEVIEALKKAQQDLKDKKDQPPPPPGGGQPPSQRLIDMLAELRMIRSLQLKVNRQTTAYGKQYAGEQADDADIQKELRNLGQRQVKIEKATKDIATGKAGGGGP